MPINLATDGHKGMRMTLATESQSGDGLFLLVVSLESNLHEFGHPWMQRLFHPGGTHHGLRHAVLRNCKIMILVESALHLLGDPWTEWQLGFLGLERSDSRSEANFHLLGDRRMQGHVPQELNPHLVGDRLVDRQFLADGLAHFLLDSSSVSNTHFLGHSRTDGTFLTDKLDLHGIGDGRTQG
jgi:hypothetical protein